MYEVNGICFAGEKNDSIKVVAAKFIADKILLVKFSTGEMRLFEVLSNKLCHLVFVS